MLEICSKLTRHHHCDVNDFVFVSLVKTDLKHFSGADNVDLEKVNANWEVTLKTVS